jgi:hypothetical protein
MEMVMRREHFIRRQWAVLLVLSAFAGSLAAADETPADTPPSDERSKRLEQLYQEEAASYVFRLDGDDMPLTLETKPVFQWTNAARINNPSLQHGLVYVWTKNGRAEIVGTIFSIEQSEAEVFLCHEFHSLATTSFEARRRGQVHWKPERPGITPAPLPNAGEPDANERLRLTEMRRIARRFSGYSVNYDEKRWELNLLAQPLYRMSTSQDDLLDQAVFAMVSTAGTDPEVLLVIEARIVEGTPTWQYSVCRFTDLKTWVSLDDKVVWSFENGTQGPQFNSDASQIYRFSSEGNKSVP